MQQNLTFSSVIVKQTQKKTMELERTEAGFYLSHFFSTHFLQWLVAKNNYISMHKLPIICLCQQSMIFNLRLWFFDGCSVVLQLTFPFSLSSLFSPILVLFFSIHFGVFIFFRLVRSLLEMKTKNNSWWFYRESRYDH